MPTTSPSSSATSTWWRSRCERTNGPARGPRPAASCITAAMSDPCAARISMRPSVRGGRRSVRSRPDLLIEVFQLLRGEVARLTDADDLALVGLDLRDRLRDLAGDLLGNRHDTVLIGVDQLAGLHPEAAELHRQPEVEHVDVRVRDRDMRGGEL